MSRPPARPAPLIVVGALAVAGTTALEILTAPYSPAVVAYPLNPAVHVGKVVGALVLVAGLVAYARVLWRTGARSAGAAVGALAVGTVAGAIPYSVVEALLHPGLSPAAADARLEQIYAEQPWIVAPAFVALPVILVALVVLAVAALRGGLVPAWAPAASLAAIPMAVLAAVLNGLGWPVPHPPAWIFAGLAAYGFAGLRKGEPQPAVLADVTSQRS